MAKKKTALTDLVAQVTAKSETRIPQVPAIVDPTAKETGISRHVLFGVSKSNPFAARSTGCKGCGV